MRCQSKSALIRVGVAVIVNIQKMLVLYANQRQLYHLHQRLQRPQVNLGDMLILYVEVKTSRNCNFYNDTFFVSAGPLQGFAIICLPHSMYIRMSIIQLQQMLSHDFDPVSLHLNDPSCGVIKADSAHVVLGTPLNGCGTERMQIGSSLTFTNKVAVDSSYAKRVASRTSPFEFPFRCSYMRTNRKRMFAPPRIQNGRVGQW